jgi:hypothetical protein
MLQCLITHNDDSTVRLQAVSLTSMQHPTYKISKFSAEKQLNIHAPYTVSAAIDVIYSEIFCLKQKSAIPLCSRQYPAHVRSHYNSKLKNRLPT